MILSENRFPLFGIMLMLPRSSGPAHETFSDRSRAFKSVAGSECGDCRPAAADQRTAGGARAGDRHRIDLGDDLVERDRPAKGQHLARDLAGARATSASLSVSVAIAIWSIATRINSGASASSVPA